MERTHEIQKVELNERVKVRVAPSKIHGVGIFALRYIGKGEKLYAEHMPVLYTLPYSSFDELYPQVRQLLLERWPSVVNGAKFVYPTERIQALMNHSDSPNYDAIRDIMLEDVKEGEEITEDYRLISGWEVAHPWLASRNMV